MNGSTIRPAARTKSSAGCNAVEYFAELAAVGVRARQLRADDDRDDARSGPAVGGPLSRLGEQPRDQFAQLLLQPNVLAAGRRAREAGVDASHLAVAAEKNRGRIGAEVHQLR